MRTTLILSVLAALALVLALVLADADGNTAAMQRKLEFERDVVNGGEEGGGGDSSCPECPGADECNCCKPGFEDTGACTDWAISITWDDERVSKWIGRIFTATYVCGVFGKRDQAYKEIESYSATRCCEPGNCNNCVNLKCTTTKATGPPSDEAEHDCERPDCFLWFFFCKTRCTTKCGYNVQCKD